MRYLAVIVVAALAVLPAGAEARHRKPRRSVMMAKAHAGRSSAPVAWTRRPLPAAASTAPVAAVPVATPVASATPAPTAAPTATATPAPTTVPVDNPHSVSVRSTEYRFSLSQPSVDAGEVHVQFDNSRAEDAHALAYRGPSADAFDPIDAGAVTRYTVTLPAGAYTLYCPLPQHEGLGMKATLTVR